MEKNIQEENHSTEIIEEILELSRDNQKLLRNPDSKLNDSIDELKERLDLTLSKVERNIDFEERRMPRKYKSMFMEELIHSILPDCQKQYAFLIVLSMVQDKLPWIYNIGKELLEMLSSENSIDVKRESINNFRRIMEVSFEHPMMREVYMRKKDDYILMRDMEHILMELVGALEKEIID